MSEMTTRTSARVSTPSTEPQDTLTTPGDSASAAADAPPAKISRRRLIGVDVLIGVTTVLLIVGIFATWANRLLFSPDNWSKTSTQLLQDDERPLHHGQLRRRSAVRERERRRD